MSAKTINGLVFDQDLIQLHARYDSRKSLSKALEKDRREKIMPKRIYRIFAST